MTKMKILTSICMLLTLSALLALSIDKSAAASPKETRLAQGKGHSMNFEVIKKGRQSGITQIETDVINTQEDWKKLWDRHDPSKLNKIQNIDFSKKTVLAVFLGEKPNAGFSVEIVSIDIAGTTTNVAYSVKKPAPGAITAQMMTQPYQIVVCDKITGQVVFEER